MEQQDQKDNWAIFLFFGFFYFAFSFFIFFQLADKPEIASDLPAHMTGVRQILDGGLFEFLKSDTYPLLQLLIALIAFIPGIPLTVAAAFVVAALNVITYVLIYRFFISSQLNSGSLAFMTCALLLLGPVYIPWFNPNIYLGQCTPNIWHNPTTICLRPFALVTFLLITKMIKECEETKTCGGKDLACLSVMLVFCNLAKPSFEQALIPGLALYFIIKLVKGKGNNFFLYLKIAAAFIPSVLLLAIQWFMSFSTTAAGGDNKIAIGFFEVINLYTPNAFVSFILGMAFPLYVMICNWNSIKNKSDLQILVCSLIAAYLEWALLMETGIRKTHGNFGWAYAIFMFIVYVFSMREFLAWNKKCDYSKSGSKIQLSIGWILFFIQLLVGIYYVTSFKYVLSV